MEKSDISVKKVINKKGVRVYKFIPGSNNISFDIEMGTIVTVLHEHKEYVKIDTGYKAPFCGWVLKSDIKDLEVKE